MPRPAASRGEDALLGLGPEALQRADPLGLGGGAQRSRESIAELLVQPAGALGPEPGQVGHVEQAGRELRPQLDRGGIAPSSASASTFSWMIAPTPGSSVARPSRASAVTDTGASRTALAALR